MVAQEAQTQTKKEENANKKTDIRKQNGSKQQKRVGTELSDCIFAPSAPFCS